MEFLSNKPLLITDTILRDAHQSQAATRMTLEQMLPACEILDSIGYYSLECWGGATFDACLRFLDEDPWERLRQLRAHLPHTKLQMLFRGQNILGYKHYADGGEEYDRIHGFELGVDDYVTKPFSPKELMMRVQAILKRSDASSAPRKEILEFEGLKIDFTGRLVYVDGEKINLSPKEYELLFYLVRNRGIALTREKLINDVWGYDFFGDDRTLDTHIKLLRKALGKYSSYIVTLRGVGYRFEA